MHGECVVVHMGDDIDRRRLASIGGGALLSTYWVPGPLVLWDLPWEAVTGTILWVYLWFNNGRLGKKGGVYLVALYVAYVALRFRFFAVD